jgi:hypothetical protein
MKPATPVITDFITKSRTVLLDQASIDRANSALMNNQELQAPCG